MKRSKQELDTKSNKRKLSPTLKSPPTHSMVKVRVVHLPLDVLVLIARYFTIPSLVAATGVSTLWNRLGGKEEVWRNAFFNMQGEFPELSGYMYGYWTTHNKRSRQNHYIPSSEPLYEGMLQLQSQYFAEQNDIFESPQHFLDITKEYFSQELGIDITSQLEIPMNYPFTIHSIHQDQQYSHFPFKDYNQQTWKEKCQYLMRKHSLAPFYEWMLSEYSADEVSDILMGMDDDHAFVSVMELKEVIKQGNQDLGRLVFFILEALLLKRTPQMIPQYVQFGPINKNTKPDITLFSLMMNHFYFMDNDKIASIYHYLSQQFPKLAEERVLFSSGLFLCHETLFDGADHWIHSHPEFPPLNDDIEEFESEEKTDPTISILTKYENQRGIMRLAQKGGVAKSSPNTIDMVYEIMKDYLRSVIVMADKIHQERCKSDGIAPSNVINVDEIMCALEFGERNVKGKYGQFNRLPHIIYNPFERQYTLGTMNFGFGEVTTEVCKDSQASPITSQEENEEKSADQEENEEKLTEGDILNGKDTCLNDITKSEEISDDADGDDIMSELHLRDGKDPDDIKDDLYDKILTLSKEINSKYKEIPQGDKESETLHIEEDESILHNSTLSRFCPTSKKPYKIPFNTNFDDLSDQQLIHDTIQEDVAYFGEDFFDKLDLPKNPLHHKWRAQIFYQTNQFLQEHVEKERLREISLKYFPGSKVDLSILKNPPNSQTTPSQPAPLGEFSNDLVIKKEDFLDLVDSITEMYDSDTEWDESALLLIQEVTEKYITWIFDLANTFSEHSSRVELLKEDLQYAKRLETKFRSQTF